MDIKALKQKIDERGLKIKYLAKELNLSYEAMCRKVKGENEFKASEMRKLADILDMSNDDIVSIFFT